MGSSLLLVFSHYCSFGKKKCMIFAVCSTFLNYWTEPSSVSQVVADHHVESWGESSEAFPYPRKAKLDVMILTQPFKKLPHVQIWQQTNRMPALRLCLLSLLKRTPVSSVGCLLPRVFLDIQRMWTAEEQDTPPSPAAQLLSLTDAPQAQPCAANSTERTCNFTKLLNHKSVLQVLTRKVLKFASFRWGLLHLQCFCMTGIRFALLQDNSDARQEVPSPSTHGQLGMAAIW